MIGPRISISPMIVDYDTLQYGGNGRNQFVLHNTGDQDLVISNIKATCGCVTTTLPRDPIPTQDSAVVRSQFDTHRKGPHSSTATVHSNALNHPFVVVRIKAFVIPP